MPTSRDRWLALIYAAAIFVSAFLLFQIQPLISKRILPWFGGTPAVWTTCLLFFQTVLFAGYAYAHWSSSWLKPRAQALVHAALIILALVLMRVLPSDRWEPSGSESPIPDILLILAVSIGVPYFILSATGPLLQAWFARSFPGRIPYRLYALSNIGSLLALISYPFFFERTFNLRSQANLWTAGFVVYAALAAYLAWRIRQTETLPSAREQGTKPKNKTHDAPPQPRLYAFWLILAAFGSLVLIVTTNHVSTDIAVTPLLWVVPLALYLLTFIIAFDRPTWYRRVPIAILVILAVYAAAATNFFQTRQYIFYELGTLGLVASFFADPNAPPVLHQFSPLLFIASNFAALFVICLMCHGEIVRTRPAPRYLTAFYLMISAGGALGGIFATLIAPLLFETYFEWGAAMFVACLASFAVLIRARAVWMARGISPKNRSRWFYARIGAAIFGLLAVSIVALFDVSDFLRSRRTDILWRERNFFGALAIQQYDPHDDNWRLNSLFHGVILHGTQFTNEARRRSPTTYFGRETGVGRAIDYFQKQLPPGKLRMAVVGLGAGTLACYPDSGDSLTFYEINPAVIEIADQGRWFTYVKDCRARGARCDIRLGDARLTLRREVQEKKPLDYHVIVLDAFSGDSIPVHLLTAQAFELYLSSLASSTTTADKQAESGAIAVHVSNLYLNLDPVIRGVAERYNLTFLKFLTPDVPEQGVLPAEWLVLTQNKNMVAALSGAATKEPATGRTVLWTDDRSSLLEVLK